MIRFMSSQERNVIDWKPIETVPRDRYVLLFDPDTPAWDGNMEVGKWFGDDEPHACFWSCGGPNGGLEIGGGTESRQFSHWAELPVSPSQS